MPGDDPGLPAHLRERPRNKLFWGRPTAWLLGTQLVASLRDIVLSSVSEFDPRDWMAPGEPIDLSAAIRPATGDEPEGAWIDFLADTGDSPRLVYRLAYLLQQGSLEVRGVDRPLPRGAALVIGGDTAYPVADHTTLIERVRAPMLWARAKLAEEGRLDDAEVPLLGIPGNHDYYNVLHGYVRQFRVPSPPNPTPGVVPPLPRFDLPGYRPLQQASYFALLLPYQWQLWGLDVEMKKLDERQRAYFLELAARAPTTSRIVVTSQPTMVYHAPSERSGELADIFRAVGLPAAFTEAKNGVLPPERVQLDLSGDVHTYERYWGTDLPATTPSPAQDERTNYASVVSGLGGAFHHPAQIRFGKRPPRCAWPPVAESAGKIGERLVRPRKLFQAGAVGVSGGALAAFSYWMVALVDGALEPTGHRKVGILDAPFAHHWLGDLGGRLANLAITAGLLTAIGLLIGLTALAVSWMGKLAAPIGKAAPLGSWASLTYRIAHNRVVYWCLRWVGGDRRRTWRALITAPIWIVLVPLYFAFPYALYRWWPHVGRIADGFAPLYVLVVVQVVAGFALGALVGGARRGVLTKIVLGLFGTAIAVLIVWTWYGWTLIIVQADRHALWALSFLGFWVVRKGLVRTGLLGSGTAWRRIIAVAGFALLAIAFIAIPLHAVTMTVPLDTWTDRPALPMWGVPIAALLGGYFACLWIGWYFLVCLQFNAHGNEAGGAARITSYAEFLRIKLTPGQAEVWVIAAEGPTVTGRTTDDHPIAARLVDHFVVKRA